MEWLDGLSAWLVAWVSAAELEFVVWVSGLRGGDYCAWGGGKRILVMDEPSTSWEGNGRLQRGRL